MTHKPATDTIAAIATPGEGAIAIIRLSGPRLAIATRPSAARPTPPPPRRTFIRGKSSPRHRRNPRHRPPAHFQSPHSYTGENSVEIQCHGGTKPPNAS